MTSFVMQISFLKEQPQSEVNINSGSWENIAMQLEILLTPKPFQKLHLKFKEQALLCESRQFTSTSILGWRCFWVALLCPEERHKSYYRPKLQISVMEIGNDPLTKLDLLLSISSVKYIANV